MSSDARLQAVVHGRVQGVGFRYYAQARARELGLTGHVRNRWDDTVEVVAEGRRPVLEQFLGYLWEGPRGAFVTGIDVEWVLPAGDYTRFEVRY